MAKVTVLMPVYNAGAYLEHSIRSILGQTWTDFEFLIVNDGSTDNSRDIVLSFRDARIRLIENSANIGLTKSLNRGLKSAGGEYVARQDADDISCPARLERQVKFLDAHPDVVLLGTRARAVDEKGAPTREQRLRIPVGLHAIRWYLMFQNAFVHSSVMFRRTIVWEKIGGYNESFERAQDYELWSRIARTHAVENLPETLIDHRHEYGSVVSGLPLPVPAEENIVSDNLRAFLEQADIPADWAHHINRFRRKDRFDRHTEWGKVSEMFEKIYDRYCHLIPESKVDRTIQSHFASNLYWLAYYAAPHDRGVSFKAFNRARKLAAKGGRHPSLLKYAMLWGFGENARRLYRRVGKAG